MMVADELERRLGARARRAVAGRREDLRQPGYRRLAQRAPLHPADAPVRRRGAADAGDGGRQEVGRRRRRGRGAACTRSCTSRPAASSAIGELAADAAALPVPAEDKVKLKDASAFRYIGKGNVRIADLVDITTGKAIYGQDVMLPGMKFAVIARPPVVGGKVASLDCSAAHEGAGRGEDRDAAADAGALQVRAARRRRGHRQEHLGGDEGPRRAQDHLGRRTQQGPTTPRPTGRSWRRTSKQARQGRAQRRRCRQGAGLRRQGHHGGVLRAAHSRTRPWSRRRPRRA